MLRTQEVYRMPSIGSISAILDRSHHHQEQAGMNAAAFPLIDPLDAFYLLNPSGDLSSSQTAFEKWFRDQNIEGHSTLHKVLIFPIYQLVPLLWLPIYGK